MQKGQYIYYLFLPSEYITDYFAEYLETLYICDPEVKPRSTNYFECVDTNSMLWRACIQKYCYDGIITSCIIICQVLE